MYIEVDELPEGAEALDLVTRESYNALEDELQEYQTQRDKALESIDELKREIRKVKSEYANMVLGDSKKDKELSEKKEKPARPMTLDELF